MKLRALFEFNKTLQYGFIYLIQTIVWETSFRMLNYGQVSLKDVNELKLVLENKTFMIVLVMTAIYLVYTILNVGYATIAFNKFYNSFIYSILISMVSMYLVYYHCTNTIEGIYGNNFKIVLISPLIAIIFTYIIFRMYKMMVDFIVLGRRKRKIKDKKEKRRKLEAMEDTDYDEDEEYEVGVARMEEEDFSMEDNLLDEYVDNSKDRFIKNSNIFKESYDNLREFGYNAVHRHEEPTGRVSIKPRK